MKTARSKIEHVLRRPAMLASTATRSHDRRPLAGVPAKLRNYGVSFFSIERDVE